MKRMGREPRTRGLCRWSHAWGALCALSLGAAPGAAQDGSLETGAETHAVAEGDTLWDLSRRYYGSPYEWPRLWSFNPEITNPHWIYPGHVLRLREGAAVGPAPAAEATAAPKALRLVGRAGAPKAPGTVRLGEHVYLDAQALAKAGTIVGSPEDHLMMSPSDEVYLKLEKGERAPQLGQELSVFVRLHRAEVSPHAGVLKTYDSEKGEIVRVLGALKIVHFDERKKIARAVITEALDPIERGFEVSDIPRELAQVPPRTNTTSVRSEIVAATRPLGTLAQNQVVFIGAGSKQGVQVGNRFAVLRQGDVWRDNLTLREDLSGAERPARRPLKPTDYPEEVVGEARVIYVRPESCTALITEALTELSPGDSVEMRAGY